MALIYLPSYLVNYTLLEGEGTLSFAPHMGCARHFNSGTECLLNEQMNESLCTDICLAKCMTGLPQR